MRELSRFMFSFLLWERKWALNWQSYNNVEGELKLEIDETVVREYLSISNKFMFTDTNCIPQLFTSNLKPIVGRLPETVKSEKTLDHLTQKKIQWK